MLEKPNLHDDEIIARLREDYGFNVTALEFLPIGNDVGSYLYRVETHDGSAYFLKARRAPMYEPSVIVPHYLNDHGIHQVVSPLLTLAQKLWVPFGLFNLILYPFIAGGNGMDVGMTDLQWVELGAILKRLHTIELSPELQAIVQRESFERPYWVDMMHALQTKMDEDVSDPISMDLSVFWKERNEQINQLMARTLELGRVLQTQPLEFVLCHSDIHTANVLVEPGGALHVVDWDQPLQAPKERDLMFFGAGLGSLTGNTNDAQNFYAGYGPTEIDRTAFAYYRYAWVMQDWVACGAEVLLHNELGELTKRNSLRAFIEMFDPGNVVDVAYQSDQLL